MKETGIVVVVYNQRENIELLFESLNSQTYKDYKVYFVDNNSSDNSYEYTKKLNESLGLDIKYLLQKENHGFAKGNNIGAESAEEDGCKFIFILNNDIELHSNCLEELVNLAKSDEKIGAVAPIIFYWGKDKKINRIQEYGGKINLKFYKIKKYFTGEIFENIKGEIPGVLEVEFVSGGAIFIKSDVTNKTGLWDERYFAYGDEIDLCKRIKEAGYKLMVIKNAVVWHSHNWGKENKLGYYIEYYLMERNKFLYFRKYKLYLPMLLTALTDILRFPFKLRWFIKVCDAKLGAYYLKGLWDGILNKPGKPGIKLFGGNI